MGDIVIKKDGAVQIAKKFGTQTAIKPLEKEVFLKDLFVRDSMINQDKLCKLKIGDSIDLKREPQPYDDLIVAVFHDDVRLGELADFDEEIVARLLDAGKKIVAKVKNIVLIPEYGSLEISMSMIDY
mgnify:CR=1 FL=1